MWFALIWLTVLAVDLSIWVLVTRFPNLHLQSYRHPFFHRPLIIARHDEDKEQEVLKRAWTLLPSEAVEMGGLTPPSNVRKTLSLVIFLQNFMALITVGSGNVIRDVSRRSGQLALLNTIPLVLLAYPDLALAQVVNQSGPEIIWAHHLMGWVVWLELVAHAGLATVAPVHSSKIVAFLPKARDTNTNAVQKSCNHLHRCRHNGESRP